MLKIAIGIAVPLAIGFFIFPQFRAVIVSFAPLALFAICPLSMIFCMKGMSSGKKGETCSSCMHNEQDKKHEHLPSVS